MAIALRLMTSHNEQLFERCQSALEREPAISHIVFREGECISNVSYYCIDGIYYAGAIPGKELANIVSELENAIPLRRIQIRDGGKKVNFFLQVSNLLNAAGIWYLEDSGLDTMYIKTYIKESVECIPNWFCYIT